jgi:hypothetical protein
MGLVFGPWVQGMGIVDKDETKVKTVKVEKTRDRNRMSSRMAVQADR